VKSVKEDEKKEVEECNQEEFVNKLEEIEKEVVVV